MSKRTGSGHLMPPAPLVGSAASLFRDAAVMMTDAPQVMVSRVECNFTPCVERHAKRGLSHGAFLYELRWGVVEHEGMLLAAVSLQTVCRQCGTVHTHIEVPNTTTHRRQIEPT